MKKSTKIILITSSALFAVLVFLCCSTPRMRTLLWRLYDRPEDIVRTQTFYATRGEIFDCNGNVIATNKTLYDVYMDCCVVDDPREWEDKSRKLAQEIAQVLPVRTAPEWWEYFQESRRHRRRFIKIVKDVDWQMVDSLRTLTLFNEGRYYGGLIVSAKDVRVYPYGNLARRTVGVRKNTLENISFGLEGQYEADLNGENGFEKTRSGYRLGKRRQWRDEFKECVDGWNIHTALNMKFQTAADSVLRNVIEYNGDLAGGCLAMMEVETGEIRALANIHRLDDGRVGEYFNYFLDYGYEPGEVAQTMTLAAALSDGVVKSLSERIPTKHGRINDTIAFVDDYIRNYERKMQSDSISVMDGFAASSRYVSADIALRYSDTPDYYYDWIKTFCIDSYDFDLNGVRNVDLVSSLRRDANTLAAMGSGYELAVTPIHVLTFYNAVANGGKMMRPMVVKRMESNEYGSQYMAPKELHPQVLRPEVADSLKKALSLCVSKGTAQKLKGTQIIGKTGTSRQIIDPKHRQGSSDPYSDAEGRRQYASSFVGFYPETDSEYTVICVLFTGLTRNPVYGGNQPLELVKDFVSAVN